MNVKVLKATVRPPQDEETNLTSIACAALLRIGDWYGAVAMEQALAIVTRKVAEKKGAQGA